MASLPPEGSAGPRTQPLLVRYAIAAGGKSTRFGVDKATFSIDGRRMVDRVAAAIPVPPFVVLPPRAEDEPRGWTELRGGYQVVTDNPVGIGPMGALRAALAAADGAAVFLIACDMPFVTAEAIRRMTDRFSSAHKTLVALSEAGRMEPLFSIYHPEIAGPLDEAIAAGRYSMRGLLARSSVEKVEIHAESLRNINTPGDL